MRRRLWVVPGAALVLVASLNSCGSQESGTPAGDPETAPTPAPFDVTTATITDQPFCDRVDTSLVAAALDMSADKVKLRESREVGEEFEGPVEEKGPAVSKVNSCVYGSATRRFIVTVRPDGSASQVQETIDFYARLGNKGFASERCASEQDASFGEPAAVATCHGRGASKRASVVVTGLVGGSMYYCSAILNTGSRSELRDPTVEACRSTLETISAGPEG